MENDIIDLQAEKDRRALAALLQESKSFKGFDNNIDLCGKEVIFTGHVIGGAADARLTVIAYLKEGVGGYAIPIGAMRFDPVQWREMLKFGSRMLKGHIKASER